MTDNFNTVDFIQEAIEQRGFEKPTEIQAKCIPVIMEGRDVVGRSVTGSGKTLAYGLPAIQMVDPETRVCQVLVVCPTRELCVQVTEELRKVTEHREGCRVVPIYGGSNMEKQVQALKNGKIVVGTPGRLMDHLRRKTLKLNDLKLAVLDEADEMLNMGFREDIECILKQTSPKRQTLMFSATMPDPIKAIAKKHLKDPEYIEIGQPNSTIDEIEQTYIRVSGAEKKYALIELFRRLTPKCSIIFCNTKRMVDALLPIMTQSGYDTLALHGDMRQNERKRVMAALKAHQSLYLIATDVAARGIDIDDVEYIFNYDMPNDMENYIHRIGRTGRAGKSGKAITFIGNQDELVLLSEVQMATKSDIQEHEMAESIERYAVQRAREARRNYFNNHANNKGESDKSKIPQSGNRRSGARKPYRGGKRR
ncbi:MAG: DEAD/DEAH box helicase [Clostridia bacterium]|nr:DEAD/DEAH box helicase [Clostridia bacterium]